MRDRADKLPHAQPDAWLPLLICILVVAVGTGFMAVGHWRIGAMWVGAASLLAAALRLVLPVKLAGLLVMRRRWVDVVVLAFMGAAIIAVALSVPPGP